MSNLMNLIQIELRKIAFLLKAENVLDKLELPATDKKGRPNKIKNVLESLPVVWSKVISFGKYSPRYYDFGVTEEEKSWSIAELFGKIKDNPIQLAILKNIDKYKYKIKFKDKKYQITNIDHVFEIIKELSEKKEIMNVDIITDYRLNLLKNKNTIIKHLVDKFLSKVSNTEWFFLTKKRSEFIFTITINTYTEADKAPLEKKLIEEMDEIILYLKTFANKNAEKMSLIFDLIKKQRKLGVNITVSLVKEQQ